MSSPAPASSPGIRIDPTATIHPSSSLEGDVTVGPGTEIGPGCVIQGLAGPVTLGAGCRLVAAVSVMGPIAIGDRNVIYPHACLGFPPQDLGFDPATPGPGCIVGNDNVFREGATVHRGKTAEPTRIGDRNLWMANSHLGHDGVVGNDCSIGTGTVLGGHVVVEDRVTMRGAAAMHQFARAGRGSSLVGAGAVSTSLPPWFECTSINATTGINIDGLRRDGADDARIDAVQWTYDTLYGSGSTPQQAFALLEARAGDPVVDECLAFVRQSPRGICHGAGRAGRGMVHSPHGS